MALAAKKTGMAYTSFIKKAKRLGCYKPNQGHKGVRSCRRRRSARAGSGEMGQFLQSGSLRPRINQSFMAVFPRGRADRHGE